MKRRLDATGGEVDAAYHPGAIFSECLIGGALKVERQTGVILNTPGNPNARQNAITNTAAEGVPLVLLEASR